MIEICLPEPYRLLGHDALSSTNDEAKRLAQEGAAAWTLVWARRQTAGRGRRLHVWISPPGNLYLSLILRPRVPVASAAQLGFVAALAIGEALADRLPTGSVLGYKWPNDVLVDGRKIAGILLESAATGGVLDWLVLGLGLNIASHPAEMSPPAVSLAALTSPAPSIETMLTDIATSFLRQESAWRAQGFAAVRRAWLRNAQGLGAPVDVLLARESFTGRFLDLDIDGALIVETASGRRRVSAGEVFPAAA